MVSGNPKAARALAWAAAGLLASLVSTAAVAADEATFRIEFKDGVVTPQRLEVPAGKRIILELVNSGTTPAEFESKELRKEKVLAPGTTSTLVFRTLEPGEYEFFDDFHLDVPPAVLVVK